LINGQIYLSWAFYLPPFKLMYYDSQLLQLLKTLNGRNGIIFVDVSRASITCYLREFCVIVVAPSDLKQTCRYSLMVNSW